MSLVLDLRQRNDRSFPTLVDGMPFKCGWCGERFLNARQLVDHISEQRKAEA